MTLLLPSAAGTGDDDELDDLEARLAGLLLEDEEFEVLSPQDQRRYLAVLHAALVEDPTPWDVLQPKQAMAEWLSGQVDELLYGGAAGGGKSHWLLYHFHHLSLRFPGHESLLVRTSFPELKRTLIRRSILFFARTPVDERPVWKSGDKVWEYPNGSLIQFGYLDRYDDVFNYLSTEYDCIGVDELTLMDFDAYTMLMTRARTTIAKEAMGIRSHAVTSSNPGGVSHGPVKRTFPVEPEEFLGREDVEYEEVTRSFPGPDGEDVECVGFIVRQPVEMPDDGSIEYRTFGFVPATVRDNRFLSRRYVVNLASKDEVTRRQYLDGDWSVFKGQFFSEFRRVKMVPGWPDEQPWHVVTDFEPPVSWYRAFAVDHGYSSYFAVLFAAWDPDGRMFCYREVYAKELTPTQQAKLVLEMLALEPPGVKPHGIADDQMWQKQQGPVTIARQWADAGLRLSPAGKSYTRGSRIAGWARVRDYLLPAPVSVAGPDGEEVASERPALVFMTRCRNAIRTIPELVFSETQVEDLNEHQEDHLADTLNYLCTHRPRRIRLVEPPTPGLQGRAERAAKAAAAKGKRRRQSFEGLR